MTKNEILDAVFAGTMSREDAEAALERLTPAASERQQGVYFKVSEKGAVSAYNVGGRFPVTLYSEGWERVLEPSFAKELRAFLDDNKPKLSTKEISKARKEADKAKFTALAKVNAETMTAKEYHAWYAANRP